MHNSDYKKKKMVVFREFRPLAELYPPPHTKKVLYRAAISSFALYDHRGGMLMPTAFAPLSIASV